MVKVVNVTNYAVDSSTGRVIAPGETARVDAAVAHNKSLIDRGVLMIDEPPKENPKKKEEK